VEAAASGEVEVEPTARPKNKAKRPEPVDAAEAAARKEAWKKRFKPLPPLPEGVVLGCKKCKEKKQGCRVCRNKAGYPVPDDW
jgi:hypothetical protein